MNARDMGANLCQWPGRPPGTLCRIQINVTALGVETHCTEITCPNQLIQVTPIPPQEQK